MALFDQAGAGLGLASNPLALSPSTLSALLAMMGAGSGVAAPRPTMGAAMPGPGAALAPPGPALPQVPGRNLGAGLPPPALPVNPPQPGTGNALDMLKNFDPSTIQKFLAGKGGPTRSAATTAAATTPLQPLGSG